MDPSVSISHPAALIRGLGLTLPAELDGLAAGLSDREGGEICRPVVFRFGYRDVPFTARIERRGATAMLCLNGDFGALPFTAEAAHCRRRVLLAITVARRDTGLDWRRAANQTISVAGEVALAAPLTPTAMIAGVVGLLLRAEPYLDLLIEVLGEADKLTSPRAA